MAAFFAPAALVLVTFCLSVHAQDSSNIEQEPSPARDMEFQSIVIEGMANADRTSVARLHRGSRAFESRHQLAPQANLRFEAVDSRQASPSRLALKLDFDERSMPVVLDHRGTFVLPILSDEDIRLGEVVANRRAGDLRVRPYVRTPGIDGESRRLGDIRMECAVQWAMDEEDVSALIRAAFSVVGGACNSSQIAFYISASRKLRVAELAFGERRQEIPIAEGGFRYWPPMHDHSWPDEALVKFTFAETAPGG